MSSPSDKRKPILRVKDWSTRFESAKSKTYRIKSQTYMPNKQGLGYNRMMRQPDGCAMYGAWCAMINLLSRMESPREGYLTDNGRSDGIELTPDDIATLTQAPLPVVAQMIQFCRLQVVGWLEVTYIKDTAVSVSRIPSGYQADTESDEKPAKQVANNGKSTTSDDCGYPPLPSPSPLPNQTKQQPLQDQPADSVCHSDCHGKAEPQLEPEKGKGVVAVFFDGVRVTPEHSKAQMVDALIACRPEHQRIRRTKWENHFRHTNATAELYAAAVNTFIEADANRLEPYASPAAYFGGIVEGMLREKGLLDETPDEKLARVTREIRGR